MTGVDVDPSQQADAPLPPPDPGRDEPNTVAYRLGAGGVGIPATTRRGKVSKWDRPPPPKDWRWYVGHLGRVLIAVGILMFGFVAYQLWGTGIENAAAQRSLENDFEELLAQFDPVAPDGPLTPADEAGGATRPAGSDASPTADAGSTGSDAGDATGAEPDLADSAPADAADDGVGADGEQTAPPPTPEVVPVTEQNLPLVEDGDALARLEIPRIGVSDIVVAGVKTSDLKRGPGHFPDTPLPGQLGNAAIAGHRTTYGAPFFEVDQLENGDEVRVTTLNGVFVYRVTDQRIVSPSEYSVVSTTDPTRATLTLVSCHPRYTARQRIIISAELDPAASSAVGEPVLNYGRPDEPTIGADDPSDGDVDGEVAGELPAGADGADTTAADDPATAAEVVDDPTVPAGSGPTGSSTGALTVEPATPADLVSAQPSDDSAELFTDGWFSDPTAYPQVGLWGLAVTAIAVLAYLLSRRLRRDWVGALVGVVPFVVALYFLFQNVNRLLPPNL